MTGYLARAIGGDRRRAVLDENTGRGLINTLRTGSGGLVAGVPVTADSALSFATAFACTRVLAESTSMLPLILYRRRTDRGKDRATDHYLYSLLHDAPNDEMTSTQLVEALMGNVVLWGNGCARLVTDNRGQVREMWPLMSRYLQIRRVAGELIYDYNAPDLRQKFARWEILHVPGLTLNGITGLSVLGYMRRAIGLGLVLDTFSENFYQNGARPGIVLQHPGRLGEEANKTLRESWVERYGGIENVNRPAVLEEGMTLATFGMPLDDAQFLELKKFQGEEVARMFRVPPHMVGILDHATFSNIEHQGLEFVIYSLGPWLARIEKRAALDLLFQEERPIYFAEFLVDALLRGDLKTRYEAYAVGRNWGWLSADDVREKENMNPLPNGQGARYLTPMNMAENQSAVISRQSSVIGDQLPIETTGLGNGNGRH